MFSSFTSGADADGPRPHVMLSRVLRQESLLFGGRESAPKADESFQAEKPGDHLVIFLSFSVLSAFAGHFLGIGLFSHFDGC